LYLSYARRICCCVCPHPPNTFAFLQPLHRDLLAAEPRARHTVQQFASQFMPSGAASRSLRLNPRLLGRLTGNVWVEDSAGNRVDIGLAVKNAKQGLCVPCEHAGATVCCRLRAC
jgi:hypothetical protein